jgi:hypothetical protein
MSDEFWNNLDQYRELGLDAPRWIASSSDELESLSRKQRDQIISQSILGLTHSPIVEKIQKSYEEYIILKTLITQIS